MTMDDAERNSWWSVGAEGVKKSREPRYKESCHRRETRDGALKPQGVKKSREPRTKGTYGWCRAKNWALEPQSIKKAPKYFYLEAL